MRVGKSPTETLIMPKEIQCILMGKAFLIPKVNMVIWFRLLSDTTACNILMNNQKEITLIYLHLITFSFAMRKTIF